MKVELDLTNGKCRVTKEPGDPRFTRGYALPESTFLYRVQQALKAQGHDVIKKRMHKDGHLADDLHQYIRTRKTDGPGSFCVFNSNYAIYDAGEEFNKLKTGDSLLLNLVSWDSERLYKLVGTRLRQGAIGKHEQFSTEIKASSALQAMNKARQEMYDSGYDHVLFTEVGVKGRSGWESIPMMQALELE